MSSAAEPGAGTTTGLDDAHEACLPSFPSMPRDGEHEGGRERDGGRAPELLQLSRGSAESGQIVRG